MTNEKQADLSAFEERLYSGRSYKTGDELDFPPRNFSYTKFMNFGTTEEATSLMKESGLPFLVVAGPFPCGCHSRPKMNTIMGVKPGSCAKGILEKFQYDLGEDFPFKIVSTGILGLVKEGIDIRSLQSGSQTPYQLLQVYQDIVSGLIDSDLAEKGTEILLPKGSLLRILMEGVSRRD